MYIELLGEVAVVAQLHHHVQVVGSLERVHESKDIAVIKLFHYLGLGDGVADLVVVN